MSGVRDSGKGRGGGGGGGGGGEGCDGPPKQIIIVPRPL